MCNQLAIKNDLLKDILKNPDDDFLRLIYADWLEDNNIDANRSEFIRIQIELSKLKKLNVNYSYNHRFSYLKNRENFLLRKYGPVWYEQFAAEIFPDIGCAVWSLDGAQPYGWMACHGIKCIQRSPFVRGFVGRFTTQAGEWIEYGDKILQKSPITHVIYTTEFSWRGDSNNGHVFLYAQSKIRKCEKVNFFTSCRIDRILQSEWEGVVFERFSELTPSGFDD